MFLPIAISPYYHISGIQQCLGASFSPFYGIVDFVPRTNFEMSYYLLCFKPINTKKMKRKISLRSTATMIAVLTIAPVTFIL